MKLNINLSLSPEYTEKGKPKKGEGKSQNFSTSINNFNPKADVQEIAQMIMKWIDKNKRK